MDFQRSISHPRRKNDKIIVSWTRGYQLLTIHYKNELILQVNDVEQLFEGVHVQHELLGEVEIRLLVDPFILNLTVDGMETLGNDSHPIHSVFSSSLLFIIPAILNLILVSLLWDLHFERELDTIEWIGFGFSLFSAIYFITCSVLIIMNRLQAIYFGIILLILQAVLYTFLSFQSIVFFDLRFFIFFMVVIHLIGGYFTFKNYKEYKQYNLEGDSNQEILDSDV